MGKTDPLLLTNNDTVLKVIKGSTSSDIKNRKPLPEVKLCSVVPSVESDDPQLEHDYCYTEMKTDHAVEVITVCKTINTYLNGLYVQLGVGGMEMPFLVDTGASRSILSYKAYDSIPEGKRPALSKQGLEKIRLELEDGTPLLAKGFVQLDLDLGGKKVQDRVLVAAISDRGILGLQFMMEMDSELCLKREVIEMAGVEIPLLGLRQKPRVRVILVQDAVIPARSEAILTAAVEHHGY